MKWLKCIVIGVGSGVVCSIVSGNAKASVRGMDNIVILTLFYAVTLSNGQFCN